MVHSLVKTYIFWENGHVFFQSVIYIALPSHTHTHTHTHVDAHKLYKQTV